MIINNDVLSYSFGHMMDSDRMKRASKEDIARSCLAMVTYNISSLARLNAEKLVSVSICQPFVVISRFLLAANTRNEIFIGC